MRKDGPLPETPKVTEARRRRAGATARHYAKVLEAGTMEPDDWQRRNAPGAFVEQETIKAGVKVRVRRYTCNMDKYLGAWRMYREKLAGKQVAARMALSRTKGKKRQELIGAVRHNRDILDRHDHDPVKGISPVQHAAGMRFAEDYRRACRSLGASCVDLMAPGIKKGYSGGLSESHTEVFRAFRIMNRGRGGKNSALVVERVCALDERLVAVERFFGWPFGMAVIRLREGLEDLSAFYCRELA